MSKNIMAFTALLMEYCSVFCTYFIFGAINLKQLSELYLGQRTRVSVFSSVFVEERLELKHYFYQICHCGWNKERFFARLIHPFRNVMAQDTLLLSLKTWLQGKLIILGWFFSVVLALQLQTLSTLTHSQFLPVERFKTTIPLFIYLLTLGCSVTLIYWILNTFFHYNNIIIIKIIIDLIFILWCHIDDVIFLKHHFKQNANHTQTWFIARHAS